MNLQHLQDLIPPSPCQKGCVDCCTPVPFSKPEWDLVPDELKVGLDIRKSFTGFGMPLWVPCSPGFLPEKYGFIIPGSELGAAMRGGGDIDVPGSCPFSSEAGCLIYDQRPILCRLYGTSKVAVLECKRGLTKESLLDPGQVFLIMKAWSLLC